MKQIKLVTAYVMLLTLSACAQKPVNHEDDLMKFAKSNCFFWYFKSQNLDPTEIRKITAGIVEMSSYSASRFEEVALLVKTYSPKIPTKNNANITLLKCFNLESDQEFINNLNEIRVGN
ncbi:hypothetical protein FLM48_06290 [Shewanella sp. Scap07]|uniref:hypothetical protein n=1 Tax=Shewanella sp. Scap07 TaxID=2589987 RepID=UPI0015B99B58|nr:hypothetical protein [Shewanella sp. Scap07]QLE84731.1 hypothetical protein FLM48_06290 [Shewanella sp. Scap07]